MGHIITDLKENFKGGVNFTTNLPQDYMNRLGHGTFCAGIISSLNVIKASFNSFSKAFKFIFKSP